MENNILIGFSILRYRRLFLLAQINPINSVSLM